MLWSRKMILNGKILVFFGILSCYLLKYLIENSKIFGDVSQDYERFLKNFSKL